VPSMALRRTSTSAFADGKRDRHSLACDTGTDAARIADGAGAGQLERGLHHVSKFVFIFGGHQDQFGNTAEIRDVEETMIAWGRHRRRDRHGPCRRRREALKADVVNDGIESALQEGGVNGAEWTEAARGHAGSEDYRVFLCDSNIEIALGMTGTKQIEPVPLGMAR